MEIEWLGAAEWRWPSGLTAHDFCDATEQSCDVQPVYAASVLRPWRGCEALLIGVAATARGLVVASGCVQGVGGSGKS
jgi:hypothetical protein